MSQISVLKAAITLLLLLRPVLADETDLPEDLVGCNDVSCPNQGPFDRCMVEDHTFMGIGLARVPDVPSSFEGLSLVRGVNVTQDISQTNDTYPRAFISTYYLGMPSEMDAADLSGCAVIFNEGPSGRFGGGGGDIPASYGSCPDVMDEECMDALTERARSFARDSGPNRCQRLERNLTQDPISECSDFSGKNRGLGNFTITPLNNLSAVDNSSSNCWPITPKSDRLFEIGGNIETGNYSYEHIIEKGYGITSVLTVLFGSGNNSSDSQASSQLTCLKIVVDERPDDTDSGSANGASLMGYSLLSSYMAVVFGVLVFVF